MTTVERDNPTDLVGGRNVLGIIVALVLAHGCTGVPDPSRDTQPDLAAIVTVVSEAYRTEGRARPVLFLETVEICDSIDPTCTPTDGGIDSDLKQRLESELQVKVRAESEADRSDPTVPALTPVLSETGEVGVSVSLGRFSMDEEGLLRVSVSVARSGLDGVFIEYVLEPAEDGWTIRETNLDEAIP